MMKLLLFTALLASTSFLFCSDEAGMRTVFENSEVKVITDRNKWFVKFTGVDRLYSLATQRGPVSSVGLTSDGKLKIMTMYRTTDIIDLDVKMENHSATTIIDFTKKPRGIYTTSKSYGEFDITMLPLTEDPLYPEKLGV